jgi:hypothetical protein
MLCTLNGTSPRLPDIYLMDGRRRLDLSLQRSQRWPDLANGLCVANAERDFVLRTAMRACESQGLRPGLTQARHIRLNTGRDAQFGFRTGDNTAIGVPRCREAAEDHGVCMPQHEPSMNDIGWDTAWVKERFTETGYPTVSGIAA